MRVDESALWDLRFSDATPVRAKDFSQSWIEGLRKEEGEEIACR
jgi:hypothetical protein